MGFKKNNVEIEKLGITIPEAYAQIDRLIVGMNSACHAIFKVQTSRENMDKPALAEFSVMVEVDKNVPVHKQVYEYAKGTMFADWEDDIVDTTE